MTHKKDFSSGTKTAGAARLLRIITAPPFMTGALLIVLGITRKDLFSDTYSMVAAWIGLVILPLMAYPLQRFIPGFKDKGREGQRNLAFVFTLIGYTCCFIYSLINAEGAFRMFFGVYFFTIVILCVLNRLVHVRASGHSASAVSPFVFSAVYVNTAAAVCFAIMFALSIWSSLYSKRHRPSELLAGAVSFTAAFLTAYMIMK